MIDLVTNNLEKIRRIAERHMVRSLWIFGSAVMDQWDPEESDIDFLVDLGTDSSLFKRHMGLIVDLEDLLKVKVDVVDIESIAKPHFLRAVMETRVLLYERSHQTISA